MTWVFRFVRIGLQITSNHQQHIFNITYQCPAVKTVPRICRTSQQNARSKQVQTDPKLSTVQHCSTSGLYFHAIRIAKRILKLGPQFTASCWLKNELPIGLQIWSFFGLNLIDLTKPSIFRDPWVWQIAMFSTCSQRCSPPWSGAIGIEHVGGWFFTRCTSSRAMYRHDHRGKSNEHLRKCLKILQKKNQNPLISLSIFQDYFCPMNMAICFGTASIW